MTNHGLWKSRFFAMRMNSFLQAGHVRVRRLRGPSA